MRPRNLVFITLMVLCHLQLQGQTLTNAVPPNPDAVTNVAPGNDAQVPSSPLPDDPELQMLPVAHPETPPSTGVPVRWSADNQNWANNICTLTGRVELFYRDYVLHADRVVYNRSTSEVEAEGHV